ncbi:MAG TPA: class I SAM-dependent methyltransferase [Rhodanobacteraceae bacterium]|nr:class I SAM-dependent methyltransferase [Rhodanobacteraceae bacterium]
MDIQGANVERFDTIAAEWDNDPRRVLMAQKIARAMRAALAPTGRERALEFGAGTGLVTLLMAGKLAHVTAMDASAGMLGVLKRKCVLKRLGQVEPVEGRVPEDLPAGPFDLVYSSMTLHHVEDVPGLLRQLADRLAAGGRIALADLDTEDGSFHGDATGVVHHGFKRDVVAGWLRDAGFVDSVFSTAYTVQRDGDDGRRHDYPIFLAVARKPER